MSDAFKKDDIVLMSGATTDSKGVTKVHRCLGKVIEVGKYDLFAMLVKESDYNKPFRISKKRCQKVEIQLADLEAELMTPKVGDLVLSINAYFGKVEQKVGTIKKIIRKPGQSKQAMILNSTKESLVDFTSLIILENK